MPETAREELERLRAEVETPRQELERLRAESQNAFTSLGLEVTDEGRLRRSLLEPGTTNALDAVRQLKRGIDENVTSSLAGAASLIPTGLAGIVGLAEGDVEQSMNRLGLTEGAATPLERATERMQSTQQFVTSPFAPQTQTGLAIQERVGDVTNRIDTALTDFFDVGADIRRSAERIGTPPGMVNLLEPLFPSLSTGARVAGEVGAGIGTGAVTNRMLRGLTRDRSGRIGVGEELPSVEDLRNTARTAYARANRLGGGIREGRLERTAQRLENLRNAEGEPIIIDQMADPRAFAVRQRIIDDFRSGNVDFDDLNAHRRLAQSLADSEDNFTSMLGQRMRSEIDDLVFNLRPSDMRGGNARGLQQSLTTARTLWRDASAAAEIQRRIRRAQERSGQFSGSGYENALRTEFRQLSMQIIDNKQRFFTPEEVELIRQVSGGNQGMRNLGRLAPSSFLNMSVGGTALGALAGSVGLSPAFGLAVPIAGQVGRSIATRRGINAANEALEAPLRRSLLDQSQ